MARRRPFASSSRVARRVSSGLMSRKRLVAHAGHRGAHAGDVLQHGDMAQGVAGERGAGQQQAARVRHAALDHGAPGLAAFVGKTQVGQGPAHFHAVAVVEQPDGGVDRKVRPQVGQVLVGAVHAVADHAGRIDAHELRRAAVARGVEPDADKVLVQAHLVAPRQRALAPVRRVVPGADAEHQRAVGHQQLHRGAQLRRRGPAVFGQVFVKSVVHGRVAPHVVVQGPVEPWRRAGGNQCGQGGGPWHAGFTGGGRGGAGEHQR